MDRVSLYWKNATAEAVGDEHGVTDKELRQIAPRIKTLTKQMNDERKAGKLRYRDLPYDEDMIDAVNREVEHFRDKGCDVLVVLGGRLRGLAGVVLVHQVVRLVRGRPGVVVVVQVPVAVVVRQRRRLAVVGVVGRLVQRVVVVVVVAGVVMVVRPAVLAHALS